ncbi:MAG TPA: hypothetical protein VFI23_00700 [Rhizomicrobium sp.]|nr:hypothetical protein [Rhizomicrobium sp.]
MSRLLVSPLSSLAGALKAHQPSHLVSLLSPEHMIETPPGFPQAMHLKLGVNDIIDPAMGTAPPSREHLETLLAFARGWNAEQPLLIHCWAGISRSMACAFTILCDRLGPGREMEIARAMRMRAPHAQPNRLLVRHADEALARGGKMLEALESMGPALAVEEGVTTSFPLEEL